MNSAPLTDDEILMDAELVEAPDLAPGPEEDVFLALTAKPFKTMGKTLYIVKWTNGLTALVDADPSDQEEWRRLLVKAYRAGCSGRRGPVSIEG